MAISAPALVPDLVEEGARPTRLLPITQLLRISAYWLGLTAIDSAVTTFIANRIEFDKLVPIAEAGRALLMISVGAAMIGIIIQPTVGYLSDYTVSRWGRRKPYIVFGSLLDVVFLLGIAYGHTVLALAAFMMLLQVSTNIARGPFQGYVPDLVAEPQVGMASGMVGLMQVAGNVIGMVLVVVSVAMGRMELSLVAVAIVELLTMLSVVWKVDKGMAPKPRNGKSWGRIAREAWATDILRERSYVWLLVSRLLFLMAGAFIFNFVLFYLSRAYGMDKETAAGNQLMMAAAVALASLISILPASRLSDRIGRKPVIYTACVLGGVAAAIIALTSSIPVAIAGAAIYGAASGTFLAVDWALMTDIIPRASSGRYMGLSNVATGAATPIAVIIGGLTLDYVAGSIGLAESPRVVYLLAIIGYTLAVIALRPVVEPHRGSRPVPGAAAA